MRVIKALALLFALGGAAASVEAQEKATTSSKATLEVAGMACSACAKTVEKAALKIPGVTAARVNQPSGTAEIEFEPSKTTADEIAKTLSKKSGFEAKTQAPKN
jgi:copper chaperone CopZ